MHCYMCRECRNITHTRITVCLACNSKQIYYDAYGMVRRLIVACLVTITDDEVAMLAESIGCPGINHSDMCDVIGRLIN